MFRRWFYRLERYMERKSRESNLKSSLEHLENFLNEIEIIKLDFEPVSKTCYIKNDTWHRIADSGFMGLVNLSKEDLFSYSMSDGILNPCDLDGFSASKSNLSISMDEFVFEYMKVYEREDAKIDPRILFFETYEDFDKNRSSLRRDNKNFHVYRLDWNKKQFLGSVNGGGCHRMAALIRQSTEQKLAVSLDAKFEDVSINRSSLDLVFESYDCYLLQFKNWKGLKNFEWGTYKIHEHRENHLFRLSSHDFMGDTPAQGLLCLSKNDMVVRPIFEKRLENLDRSCYMNLKDLIG